MLVVASSIKRSLIHACIHTIVFVFILGNPSPSWQGSRIRKCHSSPATRELPLAASPQWVLTCYQCPLYRMSEANAPWAHARPLCKPPTRVFLAAVPHIHESGPSFYQMYPWQCSIPACLRTVSTFSRSIWFHRPSAAWAWQSRGWSPDIHIYIYI